MDPGTIGALAGVAGSLFNRKSNPMAPYTKMYKQYAPGYLAGQRRGYDYLTGANGFQTAAAALAEGTNAAARNAGAQALYYNSGRGGAGQGDMAALLSYSRGRDLANYRQQANRQRYEDMFNLGGAGAASAASGAQAGAGLAGQQYQMDQANSDWLAYLPYLLAGVQWNGAQQQNPVTVA